MNPIRALCNRHFHLFMRVACIMKTPAQPSYIHILLCDLQYLLTEWACGAFLVYVRVYAIYTAEELNSCESQFPQEIKPFTLVISRDGLIHLAAKQPNWLRVDSWVEYYDMAGRPYKYFTDLMRYASASCVNRSNFRLHIDLKYINTYTLS